MSVMMYLLVLLGSYFLGAIPTGYFFTKRVKKIDIREFGSRSTGATNVSRAMGLGWAIVVGLIDILKGAIPIFVGKSSFNNPILIIILGAAAIAGHNWSIFINFKGGRGVATSAGVAIALAPLVSFIVFLIWLLVVILSRYVSLASIVAATAFPLFVYLMVPSRVYFVFSLIMGLLVIFQHRPNIARLWAGEENRLPRRRK